MYYQTCNFLHSHRYDFLQKNETEVEKNFDVKISRLLCSSISQATWRAEVDVTQCQLPANGALCVWSGCSFYGRKITFSPSPRPPYAFFTVGTSNTHLLTLANGFPIGSFFLTSRTSERSAVDFIGLSRVESLCARSVCVSERKRDPVSRRLSLRFINHSSILCDRGKLKIFARIVISLRSYCIFLACKIKINI